jgi:YHS domain-containing protein
MKYALSFVAVTAILLTFSTGQAGDKKGEVCKCPVSGKAAVKTASLPHNGGTVYFCCENCPKEFTANKAKYAAKANFQLFCTKQAEETKCPFTGMQLNNDATVEVAGVKVAFCCQMCSGKAENVPAEQLINAVFNDKSFKKAFEIKKK